jgi:transposase
MEKKMKKVIIGGDVSQQQVDLAHWSEGDTTLMGVIENSDSGLTNLQEKVARLQQQDCAQAERGVPHAISASVHLILEPTGGYEQRLARFALKMGWTVSLVNPHQLRKWAKGIGVRAKTDSTDAKLLARYGGIMQPTGWCPPPEEIERLDHLLSRQQDLQTMLRSERNRKHAQAQRTFISPVAAENLDKSIEFITDQLAQIQAAIDDHFKNHPHLNDQKQLLQSVPGVGVKNVPILLVWLHRFDRLTKGQGTSKGLTAYAGLDPVAFQSGTSVKKPSSISKAGNKRLRHYLYLGALGGSRGNNPLKTFYQRLVNRGKPKKLALVAAARKILVWSFCIFQTQTPFDSTRYC